jgi:glycosyltransferase involved in cell wall biosynthesis
VIHDGLKASGTEGGSEDARRSLGLPLDRFVIGMVGRISDWKGQHILANALALEPLASIAAVGVVAGEAAPGQEHFGHELELLRTRLGLGERLRLLGYRDDVELVYAAVDAFAAPSTHSDSLPNAVIEAALAGLPVVGAADGGGTPEIIRDGVTGVIIPSGDPGRLASALRELATDAHGARRFGRRAAEEVGSRFRPERMLERVQAVYDEVLE